MKSGSEASVGSTDQMNNARRVKQSEWQIPEEALSWMDEQHKTKRQRQETPVLMGQCFL
jgi:predicted alpha/beta hydrolase family esterase